MQIIRFEAQNIKRLSAVTIEPNADASAIVLGGGNEEGKSSCLDAIEMALAGDRVSPPEPIRRGRTKAKVVVDLGDMIVTRRFTDKGSSLAIENREGLRYKSPQTLLDGFYNKLTFDPLAFADEPDPKKQADILRRLAGLDTSDLEDARKKAFEARTLVNRDVARAKGALEKAEHYPDITEPKDATALFAQLDDAEKHARTLADVERRVALADAFVTASEERRRRAVAAVQAARRALEEAQQDERMAESAVESANDALRDVSVIRDHVRATAPDTATMRAELAEVQDHNRKVDANSRREVYARELAAYQRQAQQFTDAIEGADTAKAQRLAAAKFPVEGLGISDSGGVTWNGIPFEQASTAVRTRVSVAIGFALNPKLKILLVRNGNDLDARNLQLLADLAKDAGGQVWVERIAGGIDGIQTVVIEDGAVQGVTLPEPIDDEVPQLDARAHAGDGDSAVRDAAPKPRRRAAAGLFEESSAK
jgi:ribosomal silencing factor RsfS